MKKLVLSILLSVTASLNALSWPWSSPQQYVSPKVASVYLYDLFNGPVDFL